MSCLARVFGRVALVTVLLAVGVAHATDLSGKARIIDGDTLAVAAVTVRLFGIDAPERKQTCSNADAIWNCGTAATEALAALISGRAVSCHPLDRDRYGRTVAKCSADGLDLGGEMVRQGLALAYRAYSVEYVPQESLAKAEGAGMWRSAFVPPSAFRKGAR